MVLFGMMAESIPDEYKNTDNIKMFSNMPENFQIEALQNNVVQTICAMQCATIIGGSFLGTVLSTLMEMSGADDSLKTLLELEEEITSHELN